MSTTGVSRSTGQSADILDLSQAAAIAGADSFIMAPPEGYDALLGISIVMA